MYFSIFALIGLLTALHQSIASEWNYGEEGPDVWSDRYPICAGRSQSPINIRTACAAYRSFKPFQFSSAYGKNQNYKLINNGHSIAGTYTGKDPSPLTITGGGLSGTYRLVNFHLHWGENYKSGSEHQVDGKKYSGEIHFVHTNPTTNATAVLGMFIQSEPGSKQEHEKRQKYYVRASETSTLLEWNKYLSATDKLQEKDDSVTVGLNLASLMNPYPKDFWRYTGSLTTPPCTEGITWTLFREPIIVDDEHFRVLRRNIYSKDFRSPQPLYDRIVYRSFEDQDIPSKFDYIDCLANY